MGQGPVADSELESLFAPLIGLRAVGLAVSGGPDSTALMHLFVRWRRDAAPRPHGIVLTVDHGLRPEAAGEAQAVVAAAHGLGLDARVLRWEGAKPASGIQEAAREARYRVLAEAMRVDALDAIVTAHTQDDQAETLLMRLARGSGLDGLAAMPALTHLSGMTLIRPFLGVEKARLLATLDALGIGYCSDPSNTDPRFERPRLRAAAPALAGLGLTNAALARTARRLDRARQALDAATDGLARDSTSVSNLGVAVVDGRKLAAAPEEIAIRLVARIVPAIGGDPGPPSLAKVEALTGWLRTATGGARTLGRTEARLDEGRRAIFLREALRSPLPVVSLSPGARLLWDGRFLITLEADREAVVIRSGGPADAAGCGKARQTLPLAVRNGEVVASPEDPAAARVAGLTFEFAGRFAVFGAVPPAET